MTSTHQQEVSAGNRFTFGENWSRFLSVLNDERIGQAEASLKEMLGVNDLQGKTFLDIGSGSGLFSLVARRLGAKVFSFDYDPQSVACTKELKRRYFADDNSWVIEEGSALDANYLQRLGQFDIVYSWGVLHHTGAMWQALGNVDVTVKRGGLLFIALYNFQPFASRYWTFAKQMYNKHAWTRPLWIGVHSIYPVLPSVVLRKVQNRKAARGMSVWYDLLDWLGGYPFEVAKPEDVFDFYKQRDYQLVKLRTVGGRLGCNEFIFQKLP